MIPSFLFFYKHGKLGSLLNRFDRHAPDTKKKNIRYTIQIMLVNVRSPFFVPFWRADPSTYEMIGPTKV